MAVLSMHSAWTQPTLVLALLFFWLGGCTFLAETEVPPARAISYEPSATDYQYCDDLSIKCVEGLECVQVLDSVGGLITSFCAPFCSDTQVCPSVEEIDGVCLLTPDEASSPPDRCALVCEGTGMGPAAGCPNGMTCSEHGDVSICIWSL